MCSVAGAKTKQEVEKMLKIQRHRSPDGINIEPAINSFATDKEPSFYIGMGRLSIIDLKSKNLCLYQDGYSLLSYNGEVYNYKELRKELIILGHKFETDSDTEVVFKSYVQWGVECFNRFNGMFALALYDHSTHSIILARDIVGQKPLFYRKKDFAFASEAKALITEDTKLENDKFMDRMQHIYEHTLYSDVWNLLPAHYVIYRLDFDRLENPVKYWEYKYHYVNPKTALEELEHLLKDAVELVGRSDVKRALYYSGGVDSSILDELGDFDASYTIDPNSITPEEFEKIIKDVVYHLDFPVGSLSSYPLYKLAKMANKDRIKVVISGEGADEVFAGYIRYLPVANEYLMRSRYPSYTDLFSNIAQSYSHLFSSITNRHDNHDESRYLIEGAFKGFLEKNDPITAMQLFDIQYVLPSLLQMGDRMASAFGIENRCPFLDKRVIEFGLSLPPEMKINNLETKVLLRQLIQRLSCRNYTEEKEKHGLTIPYNKWIGKKGYNRSHYFNLIKDVWKKQNSALS